MKSGKNLENKNSTYLFEILYKKIVFNLFLFKNTHVNYTHNKSFVFVILRVEHRKSITTSLIIAL